MTQFIIKASKRWYITMKVINKLLDNEYRFDGINETRIVVRGIVLNDNNQICLLKIIRKDDDFGEGNYYETPGGGKEMNETLEEGVIREIEEEIGYKSSIIQEIGIVEDYYNVIKRKNINHYYLMKVTQKTETHFVSYGDFFIKDVVWVSIDEAIELYNKMDKFRIERLVKNRELPILHIVKEILGGN